MALLILTTTVGGICLLPMVIWMSTARSPTGCFAMTVWAALWTLHPGQVQICSF